jgi:predicted ATP-dependent endonuclease of OLD family
MKLKITIEKIKGISHAEIVLPIEKGVYAIAGENGSGKSTIIACAACAFFQFPFEKFFGRTEKESSIVFDLDGNVFKYAPNEAGVWKKRRVSVRKNFDVTNILKGFFEGSLNFGNRFRDVSFWKIPSQKEILSYNPEPANEDMRKLFGKILHNNEEYFEELSFYKNRNLYKGDIFFYKKNGQLIDQFHMSTGENLLISIIANLYAQNQKRKEIKENPFALFLDELEMGLHPAAIKRLVDYLEEVAEENNYAIFLSTQSSEVLYNLSPDKIFYVERRFGDETTVDVKNPCFPQKAIQRLYRHVGFDRVILVEDDLARAIVERMLSQERLKSNKLVLTLPCGGYVNLIDFAQNILTYKILGDENTVSLIIDGDVKKEAKSHMNKVGIITKMLYTFLPFPSLEKYLYANLVTNPDICLIDALNDYIFQPHDVRDVVKQYKKTLLEKDNDRKIFYDTIVNELKVLHKDRAELISEVIRYLFCNKQQELLELKEFLIKRMGC